MARTAPAGVVPCGSVARRAAANRVRRCGSLAALAWCLSLVWAGVGAAQEPVAPQQVDAVRLKAAIDTLGSLDYDTRTGAARLIRRTPGTQAVPALLTTVSEHADGYVRFRALVLLTGFDDARTLDTMRASLGSPNDRIRAVAYSYFEHHPDASVLPSLLEGLEREQAELVRPMLIRALTYREKSLDVMTTKAISGGCEGVTRVPALSPVTPLHPPVRAAAGS